MTVYDALTPSEIATDQNNAALRSMFELKGMEKESTAELYFGPAAPAGKQKAWIKTIPGTGWFVDFRIYWPEESAIDKLENPETSKQ